MEALTSFFANIDWSEIWLATGDTMIMLFGSLFFTVLLGLPLGVLLFLCSPRQLFEQKGLYALLSLVVNILRSLPFIILLTELFKRFHHQIKTLGIYKSCSHKETLGFWVAFSLTHEASGINFNFCINIQKFFVIALIIVTENNVSVQLRQIFLEQTFLFPEYDIRNIKISGITVMLPSDCLCIQLRRQHTQTKA